MVFLKNAWYVAAHANELNDGLVSRKICNEQIVMYRTASGNVAALSDKCPHRYVPLSMGKRVGDTLQCGYHGLAFGPTGVCASAPNETSNQQDRIRVRAYSSAEKHTLIWLWFGEAALADPNLIPDFSFLGDTDKYTIARGLSTSRRITKF